MAKRSGELAEAKRLLKEISAPFLDLGFVVKGDGLTLSRSGLGFALFVESSHGREDVLRPDVVVAVGLEERSDDPVYYYSQVQAVRGARHQRYPANAKDKLVADVARSTLPFCESLGSVEDLVDRLVRQELPPNRNAPGLAHLTIAWSFANAAGLDDRARDIERRLRHRRTWLPWERHDIDWFCETFGCVLP